jgi:hypothetical protein
MSKKKHNSCKYCIKPSVPFPEASSENLFLRIIRGVIIPLAVWGYGVYACIMQNAILPGKNGKLLKLNGITAISYGIALIGLAVFLHFCFWWEIEHRKYHIAKICAILAMVIFIIAYGFAFWLIIS